MKTLTIAGNVGLFMRADFSTGALYWLPRGREWFSSDRSHSTWNARYAGKRALNYVDPHGYCVGRLFDKQLKAHRAIWALAHGEWPEQIDHINSVRTDNRLINLRSVSVAQNNRNMRRRRDNTSGIAGVCWDRGRGKWLVTACGNYVGRFDDFSAAAAVRHAEMAKAGFHENHGVKQ